MTVPTSQPVLSLPVILVGMPGSGKSHVGTTLARRLGVPHVDTDSLIVEAAGGAQISEIFAQEGEASFRERERQAVERALAMRAVVSLGGGAVITPAVREMLKGHSVVHLDVDHEELLRRTGRRTHRPLLLPDPDAALRRLRRERAGFYEEVEALRVHSDARPVDHVIEEIMEHLPQMPDVIPVEGPRPYTVLVGHGLCPTAVAEAVPTEATRALLVHPASVAGPARLIAQSLEAQGVAVRTFVHPDGEAGKTLDVAAAGWQAASEARLSRADVVIGLGGGATTDLAGFIAAMWLRGIAVIQAPTSLLGMVDAAVGGKTGINTAFGKNLVGAFHAPLRVVEDLDLLGTLPPEELRAGLGEVVKCGFIDDARILELVEGDPRAALAPESPVLRELLTRSVTLKARVVSDDPVEQGLREILNYGHTLAHAIERCEDYTWRHGEAVAVGCVFAAELALDLGLLRAQDVDAHRRAFGAVGLPTSYSGAPLSDLVDAMFSDKKVRADRLRFVLLDGLQRPVVRAVDTDALRGPAERIGIHVDR